MKTKEIEKLEAEIETYQQSLLKLYTQLNEAKFGKIKTGIPCNPVSTKFYMVNSIGLVMSSPSSDMVQCRDLIDFKNCFQTFESAEAHSKLLLQWRQSLIDAFDSKPMEIKTLYPFIKNNYWVAMDSNGVYKSFSKKPTIDTDKKCWIADISDEDVTPLSMFKLKPVEDWSKSLVQIDHEKLNV